MVQTAGFGAAGNNVRDEETPLLGRSPINPVNKKTWTHRLQHDISCSWADAVLLACYVVTGLLDSSSIQVWGTFVSMQTG
jgi:hypothetical protein